MEDKIKNLEHCVNQLMDHKKNEDKIVISVSPSSRSNKHEPEPKAEKKNKKLDNLSSSRYIFTETHSPSGISTKKNGFIFNKNSHKKNENIKEAVKSNKIGGNNPKLVFSNPLQKDILLFKKEKECNNKITFEIKENENYLTKFEQLKHRTRSVLEGYYDNSKKLLNKLETLNRSRLLNNKSNINS
jgi:hypothetical protein